MSSRQAILDSAGTVFREKGFSGSSIKEISARAGVSKSLIYHHFKSKREIWHAAVKDYLQRSGLVEKFFDVAAGGGAGLLEDFAGGEEGFFYFLQRNPGLVRMLDWLNLEGGAGMGLPDPEQRKAILDRMRELVKKGVFRANVDPVVLPILYMSICTGWFSSRRRYADWFGPGVTCEEMDDRFIGAAMDIIMRGALPDEKR